MTNETQAGDICALQLVPQERPRLNLTVSKIRWWAFNEETNGAKKAGVFVRHGNRVYVNLPRLDAWILSEPVRKSEPAQRPGRPRAGQREARA